MEISIPACLFVGAMSLLMVLGYFWFERTGANYSMRKRAWLQTMRHEPRLSPKVEDDERRLKNLERPDDPTQQKEWEDKQKRDFGK